MAHRQQPRSELRVPQCLLRYAWTSQVVHWCLTQSVRTAGCGPACPVVWQGRAGDRSPYADYQTWARTTFMVTVAKRAATLRRSPNILACPESPSGKSPADAGSVIRAE